MPARMTIFVPAILIILLAAPSLTIRSSRAADDCLTKPDASAPQGSHWYYRADHTTHRQCWYLGPEGAKVRESARQAASPMRPPPSRPISGSTAETRTEAVPVETTAGKATGAETTAAENDPTADFSIRWSGLPNSTGSFDRELASMSNSYSDEHPTTGFWDDMQLKSPVLSASDFFLAVKRPSEFTTTLAHLLAFLATALALAAMITLTIFKFRAARRLRQSRLRDHWGSASNATRPREYVPPAFANRAAAARQTNIVHGTVTAMRRTNITREPPQPGDPSQEIEATLRQLLRQLAARGAMGISDKFPNGRGARLVPSATKKLQGSNRVRYEFMPRKASRS
jgi:hypothetical protein